MAWRTHTANFLLTIVFGVIAYTLLAAVEYSRNQHIADHLLEQIHSRALQDFYELASHVREQLKNCIYPRISNPLFLSD